MNIKSFFYVLLISVISNAFAQLSTDLSKYEYVVVAKKFDWTNHPNEHQVNELSKFLFNKYGFEAFLEGDILPVDLESDRCKALYADVIGKDNFLKTQVYVELKDCDGNIIFQGEEGSSKEKDYRKSYHTALRKAFLAIEELNFSRKQNGVKTTINNVAEQNNIPEVIYASVDNKTQIKLEEGLYFIYQEGQFIGKAKPIVDGTFFVSTSKFEGLGELVGDKFTIKYEVKNEPELKVITLTKR